MLQSVNFVSFPDAAVSNSTLDSHAAPESVDAMRARIAGLEQQLIAYQRLALLGSMASMVGHELNNLMTPLVVRSEVALQSSDPDEMRRALEKTLVNAQRAVQFSGRLLGLGRADSEPTATAVVATVVRQVLDAYARNSAPDPVEVRVQVPEELQIRGRSDLFFQVLLNLYLNARNALNAGRGVITISAARAGEMVRIEVRDNGKGIDAAKLRELVNPFLSVDPKNSPGDWHSVGLGLSVCRLIARAHGAALRAAANDGPGCTFELLWPGV